MLVAIVEQTAVLAARAGDDDIALRLYGASRALRMTTGWVSDPDDSALTISGVRVDQSRRDSLLADGGNASLDAAVGWVEAVLASGTSVVR